MLQRTQVQLTDLQLDALRALSAHRHRSIADLVRESVDLYLQHASTADRAYSVQRAKTVIGQYSSGGLKEEANG